MTAFSQVAWFWASDRSVVVTKFVTHAKFVHVEPIQKLASLNVQVALNAWMLRALA
jgi:hypothetical protein